ncbi:hypothetical protein COT64_02045 [Candidatus Shapirobacteria bacterium CG09_land_8_20_14_0_10_39_12]|uniref:Poly A polymerase head domain-containing protein n=1 Tax=Candidatus Shapirobacteria bacterium CG09_land_8_20_14_0_10_39_12 TaxID=1974885 RepID=A0A2H0WPG3_9BACT|nr:MAG: hypothetical protein COT64_02045 [Candidatus Shapirobacteria bacterium CG09_land_8_20_14_0_10_39_12]
MAAEYLELSRNILELSRKDLEAIDYWISILQTAGTDGFLKGGFIRDKVANRVKGMTLIPNDFDILVTGKIHSVLQAAIRNDAEVIERRRRKGTPVFKYKVPGFEDITFETGVAMGAVANYDTADFESIRSDDAKNTDLNVNAMSIHLIPGKISLFDPLDAVGSITRGEVSLNDWHSLYRNPENVLRAFRVTDRIDCKLTKKTLNIFSTHAHVVGKIKRPFLDSQIIPLIDSPNASQIWLQMKILGITRYLTGGGIATLNQAREVFKP